MNELNIHLTVLEDEVLESGPACQTEIVIPCPATPTKCKISELAEDAS